MVNPYLLTSIGAAAAVFLSCLGSVNATSIAAFYALLTDGFQSFIPVVISGVLGIYGLIVGILLTSKLQNGLEVEDGYRNLCAGFAVGLTCYVSGVGMAMFLEACMYGDSRQRRNSRTGTLQESLLPPKSKDSLPKDPYPVTIKFVMMLTFLEALGLYGLIVALCLMG